MPVGTKGILVLVLGVLAAVRVTQPKFFAHWIRGDFSALQADYSATATLWSWVALLIFAGLGLQFTTLPTLWVWLGVPVVVGLRIFWATLIGVLLGDRGMRWEWRSGNGLALLALVYLVTAVVVHSIHLLGWVYEDYLWVVFAVGHAIGLVAFGIKRPALVRFQTLGTRVYAILYLCALESLTLYSSYQLSNVRL